MNNNPSLITLLAQNNYFKNRFRDNYLFTLINSAKFDAVEVKERFLNYFLIWTNYFQKTMLIKTALCDDPCFIPVFSQHYLEEFNHNEILKKEMKVSAYKKDMLLEAICNWFPSKMFYFNNYEQIVAMNLAVEAAATIFYEYAKPIIDPNNQFIHFQIHGEIDAEHEKMGIDLLENLSELQYSRLLEIQEDTWDMCELLMKRLGELAITL